MKVWTAAVAALALAACSQPAPEAPAPAAPAVVDAPSGEYTLDTYHSTVTVRAQHFGLAYYTLRFNGVSGALTFDKDNPGQSSVTVTVDTTTLDTSYIGDRDFDQELQNSEWLDTAAHPTATFRSTAVEQTGSNTARVTGDLTLRGITHPITLDVTYDGSWAQHPAGPPVSGIGFSARGTFKRSDFGITTLLPQGGPANGVSDDTELVIEAEFNRPVETATPAPAQPAEPVN